MSKIEIGRWSEQLRRMLGQKGQEHVAGELSAEISPIIELEGRSAEWDFLKGVRICGGAARVAPGVGNVSRFRLRNPTASDVLGLVTFVEIVPNVASNIIMGFGSETADLVLPAPETVLDARWEMSGSGRTVLSFSADNTLATPVQGDIFVRSIRLASTPLKLLQEIPLVPGSSLDWGVDATNVGASTYALWRERGLPILEGR